MAHCQHQFIQEKKPAVGLQQESRVHCRLQTGGFIGEEGHSKCWESSSVVACPLSIVHRPLPGVVKELGLMFLFPARVLGNKGFLWEPIFTGTKQL
jgi:hypothetical protein